MQTFRCPFCDALLTLRTLPHHCADGRVRRVRNAVVIERAGVFGYGYEVVAKFAIVGEEHNNALERPR